MDSKDWLWLGCAGMAAGAACILLIGKRRTMGEHFHTLLHGIVPVVAACSYFAMAVGQGAVHLPWHSADPTRTFYFSRYVDWAITTPMLLMAVVMSSVHSGLRRRGVMFGLIASDLLMIVTALWFGLSDTPWVKWTWYAISCGAFLAVYYALWIIFEPESRKERGSVRRHYLRDAGVLSALWLIYPILLIFSEDGLDLIGETGGVAAFAILDLLSKVAYGLMSTIGHAKIVDEDLTGATLHEESRVPSVPATA